MEWERQDPRLPRPPIDREERFFEREVVVDRKRAY